MSRVKLVLGDDSVAAKHLLARHLIIHDQHRRAPSYVDPGSMQFPTKSLLQCSRLLAEAIVRNEEERDPAVRVGRLVIIGFDDPQSPPRFGTMLANLVAHHLELRQGVEPGRVHVRRVPERRERAESPRWLWQREFFNGTTLQGARMYFVTDVPRAEGLLKHVVKTAVGNEYQGAPYDPRKDVERGKALVGGIGCLALWEDEEIQERELAKHLGFVPTILAFAPGFVRSSSWRSALSTGDFHAMHAPDCQSSE